MDKKFYITAFILSLATILTFAVAAQAQQPPRPPKDGMEWFLKVDANKNDTLEQEEFKAECDKIFKKLDRNNDGVIDEAERPRQPLPPRGGPEGRGDFPPMQDGNRPPRPDMQQGGDNRPPRPDMQDGNRPPRPDMPGPENRGPEKPRPPIPFFVMESIKEPGDVTRAQFDERINEQFRLMDKNNDGVVDRSEAETRFREVDQRVQNERPEDRPPLDSPTAQFIGAELRFGDKLVTGAPFSAETVIEDTRRLFDGSTVTKQSKGAVYRDGAGRTRREQPLDMIGGFSITSENGAPQTLVFINDFVGKTHYFLDLNRKIAQRQPLPDNRPPLADNEPKNGKSESLGTKTIEGVTVEGTRTTFEIPAGQIGNDKPIQVVTEKWYSPELQVVVYSRHLDPLSGEHIFKLVNLKKGEPAADLFTVPNGFKVENPPRPNGRRND
ncbi:MAG: EF-hand domain-containing protein [Acidobacteria bacterium]|nr:EF-hand domain-containing protein [Acidobacteriota bacterium]